MRGQVTEIYKTFSAVDRELIVPVYQRNYDWQEAQCSQLVDDLVELANSRRSKHFFGAIVGVPENSWTWTVIDGQQRLTTVSLMMLALSRLIEDGTLESVDSALAQKIRRGYLLDRDSDHNPRFKLKPIKDDAEAYRRLFVGNSLVTDSNITVNFQYFMDNLPRTGLNGDHLWEAICGLEVMQLDLEADDSPQRIFESLNSTGLALSEADKVRNLLLMGEPHKHQTFLYEEYWNRVEKNVDFDTSTFLRWYLVTMTGQTPRKDSVYEAFKKYLNSCGLTREEVAADLRSYSIHYRAYLRADTNSTAVNRRLTRLKMLDFDVVSPFVMSMLDAYENGMLPEAELVKSLRIVESYLFRRFACSVPTNSLNGIFATLFGEVSKLQGDNDLFSEALAYNLLRRREGGRFPTDDEFSGSFPNRNLYSGSAKRRTYVLEVLENLDSNDTRDIANGLGSGVLSVEHIMPQTLNPTWSKALGDNAQAIHEKYVHRIGNLTVTGYNSKYSNSPFMTKKTMANGFSTSPYRLNNYVKTVEEWGEYEMETRAQLLLEDALTYWDRPSVEFTPVVEIAPTQPLGLDTDFTGQTVVGFEFGDIGGPVESWRQMFLQVVGELVRRDRAAVFSVARSGTWYHVGPQAQAPKGHAEAAPGLSVYVSTSTQSKIGMLRALFDAADIDVDDLVFTLQRPPTEQSTEEIKVDPLDELRRQATIAASSHAAYGSEAALAHESQFMELLGDRVIADPYGVLGASATDFLGDLAPDAHLTEAQALALVSSSVHVKRMQDSAQLWRDLSQGNVARWLALVPRR